MASTSHLEKMGRELKCPICLSLLTAAVSLGCNHMFCSSCITQSMKTGGNCPVCKLPFHRRDIRPAPHMDNLVSIYKNMEVDAGVNIFVTQSEPPVKSFGKDNTRKASGSSKSKKCCKKTTIKHKSRDANLLESNDKACQPSKLSSFRANKRVHVMPYPVPDTPCAEKPLRFRNFEIDSKIGKSLELESRDTAKNMLTTCNEADSCNRNGDISFPPFFWLRDDQELDEPSKDSQQLTNNGGLPTPHFSSASAVEASNEETTLRTAPFNRMVDPDVLDCGTKIVDAFDTEMFEWTQAACSPELCSMPTMQQDHETNEVLLPIQKASGKHKRKGNKKDKISKRTHTKGRETSSADCMANVHNAFPTYLCAKPRQEPISGIHDMEMEYQQPLRDAEASVSINGDGHEPKRTKKHPCKRKGPDSRTNMRRTSIDNVLFSNSNNEFAVPDVENHNRSQNEEENSCTGSKLFVKRRQKRTRNQINESGDAVFPEKMLPKKRNKKNNE